MRPDPSRKESCYYYLLSNLSRSRVVRSFTSRREPSSSSSDLDRALASIRFREKLQLLIQTIGQRWRVFSSEDRFDGRLLWFNLRFLWAGGNFAWSRLRRLQHVCWILDRSLRHTRSRSVSEILKLLLICSSMSESAFVQHSVCDYSGCGGVGCDNVPSTLFAESSAVSSCWPVLKCLTKFED